MKFISTRGKSIASCAAEAIAKGLADDGGLFVPEFFPKVTFDQLAEMISMEYAERAAFVLHKYLEEYDYDQLLEACKNSYSKFEDCEAAPLVKVDDKFFIMELFHGPTLAFKDVALTLLPYLLRKGCDISGIKEEVLILVATSGDTGKAALEGFKDADGIKIMVFYPSEGVSDMQKLQMCTQEGSNVNVVAVKGNFDDCQTAVKKIFTSKEINAKLKQNNVILSSANSMNFGRLAPQISYYFSAYCDLVDSGEIEIGELIDFVVPTGNFGNILAGYYAKKMGLPIGKLVCASNSNNVLTEFFTSGTYDANREFFKTISPSMDILISSNLERLVFEVSGRNFSLTEERMNELKNTGSYSVSDIERKYLQKEFFADFADEEECGVQIKDIFEEYGYVVDPHTAVAIKVKETYSKYVKADNNVVILSTASPYKFACDVLKLITGKSEKDAFIASDCLSEYTAMPIPEQVAELKNKSIRFTEVIDKDNTVKAVFDFLSK